MRKISYLYLQKKYSGKIVVLNKEEKQILAVGKKFPEIFAKLKLKNLTPENCVFVGPVQKAGTINVYIISLREKNY
jgi:hypothetical protein